MAPSNAEHKFLQILPLMRQVVHQYQKLAFDEVKNSICKIRIFPDNTVETIDNKHWQKIHAEASSFFIQALTAYAKGEDDLTLSYFEKICALVQQNAF